MTGRVTVVGLGPGAAALVTPQAEAALTQATDLVGYAPYVARVRERAGQVRHVSDNREEIARARHALTLAMQGRDVAVVSGGDAGVFGMASAVFEAVEHGEPAWRTLEIEVLPGVSAMLAAAARVGAPLGHDFCALSLSDNLKPWETVTRRLAAAAEAGFVIALYNAISRARPWQLGAAFEVLRQHLPAETVVVLATAVTRPDERIEITTLDAAHRAEADMRTLVIVGTAAMRVIERADGGRWVYAPRGGKVPA
jgi:precorrin-3B C17-methyltransferase